MEAEAELLAAVTTFFKRVGLTSADVGIKVNSRGVLAEVLASLGVPPEKFAATCVLVDKLEKVGGLCCALVGCSCDGGLNGETIRHTHIRTHQTRCRWSRSGGTWRCWGWRSRWCSACLR